MNKIVRENYPVEKLPEDLRAGLAPHEAVRVTIEASETGKPPSWTAWQELLERSRTIPPIGGDPVERIRKLRDEWDD